MLTLLLACSPVRLVDDTRINLEPGGTSLGSPYVVGAEFTLLLDMAGSPEGWSVESSDPAVLELGSAVVERDSDGDAHLEIEAFAVGVGSTALVVTDDRGDTVLSPTAEVRAPTRVELRAAVDTSAGREEVVEDPQVCVGGESVFRVDFFDGDESLAGAGGLVVSGPEVTTDESNFASDHDWIVVTPTSAGTLVVDLETGGVAAGSVTLEAVDASHIDAIDLKRDPESAASRGDSLKITADALDADGERVFGAPITWSEDGGPAEEGDEYVYDFDPSVTTDVTVQIGALSETVTVHGDGTPVESDSVACAVANVGPVALAIGLSLLGVARRRR